MTRIISVDGNIGSGKSTFIKKLKEYYSNPQHCQGKKFCFLQEPIHIWNNIKDSDGKTILECFYANPEKYAFSFQMMAYISRLALIKEALELSYDIIITERCIFTDKNIFAKMLFDSKKMNQIEYKIYNTWFNEFIKDFPEVHYIYLQTDPQIAYDRIIKRGRVGENISLEYLTSCHDYHEKWFQSIQNKYIINANIDININSQTINEWIDNIDNIVNAYIITFDGASRGNPGLCGAGFVIWKNNRAIYDGKKFLCTNNTNNFAEYSALILALERCISHNIKSIIVKGDSSLVIKQLNKEYSIKSENLLPLYNKVMDLLYYFNSFELIHIGREKNKYADKLANQSIDEYIMKQSKISHKSLDLL